MIADCKKVTQHGEVGTGAPSVALLEPEVSMRWRLQVRLRLFRKESSVFGLVWVWVFSSFFFPPSLGWDFQKFLESSGVQLELTLSSF